MQLQFLIQEQYIRRMDNNKVVSDSKNYLEAYFMFSSHWDNATKTAVFSDGVNCYEMLIVDNVCVVPHEVIKTPEFTVSVFDGDLLTTNRAAVNVIESGLGPNPPKPPTEDIYDQILDLVEDAKSTSDNAEQIAKSIEERADNGEFDGKNGVTFTPSVSEDGTLSWINDSGLVNPQSINIKGPKGNDGENGLTPYIGPNKNWWIGDTDTEYQAVVDESKIEKISEEINKITSDILSIDEELTNLKEDVITTANISDYVSYIASEIVISKIHEHNKSSLAHEELFNQTNESITWKTMEEILEERER